MRQIDVRPITRLTHSKGDAIRLFRAYQKRYPKQAPDWVLEKVIEDLIRDRGVRVKAPLAAPARGWPRYKRLVGAYTPIRVRPNLLRLTAPRRIPVVWGLIALIALIALAAWLGYQGDRRFGYEPPGAAEVD